jgi:hypothetical protein
VIAPLLPPLVGALLAAATPAPGPAPVLIVADEIPAMEVLAHELQTRVNLRSDIVTQDKMPGTLDGRRAVIVYIHKDLTVPAEKAFIAYAEGGGKLVLLHHSISSGKRKNEHWFRFLRVTLPLGELEAGGYKYYDDATFSVVNVAPKHPVTTTEVKYADRKRPAFTMEKTEIYLNHVLDGPRTNLLALEWTEPKSSKAFRQETVAWHRRAGKGEIYYFMPGHKPDDFKNPSFAQMIANAAKAPVARR